MIKQLVLTKIHKALGWTMLFLLPAQLLLGLWAMGRIGGGESGLAGALHVGPWMVLPTGLLVISHGLLGIRFTVMKLLGNRPGGLLLAAIWAAFAALLFIFTL